MPNFNEVFISLLNIHLKKKSFENEFQDRLNHKKKKFNPIIGFLNLLAVVTLFILYMILVPDKTTPTSKVIISNICYLSFLAFVVMMFVIFSRQQGRIVNIICIINYFVFSLNIFTFRKIIFVVTFETNLKFVFFIDNAEMLLLVLWSLVELLDIEYILVLNICIIAVMTTCNSFIEYWWHVGYINSILTYIGHIFVVFISYYELRNSRYLLYYTKTVTEQNELYKSILQNINSGYIDIIKRKIVFMNSYIKEILLKNGLVTEEQLKDVTKLSEEDETRIYTVLVSNLNFINNCCSTVQEERVNTLNTNTHINNNNNNNLSVESKLTNSHPLDIIKKRICKENNQHDEDVFIFIGLGQLVKNGESNKDYFVYELYGRISNNKEVRRSGRGSNKDNSNGNGSGNDKNNDNDNEDEIEIILKDVTRVKIAEEKNAEIRLKSVILSKIAHEFKNPLMCLSELTKDEKNNDECSNESNICDTYKGGIQAIVNYLLFLVKDIDLFSSMQTGKAISIKTSRLSYNEFANFINMIANYLIKKYHKSKRVIFQIIPNNIPSEIETDVIKLKQILINLLTNAIKYTNDGSVLLEISIDEGDYIKFLIKDTGVGISDEMQSEFHSLFSQGHKSFYVNYGYGTGLGLIIAKEISSLLGKSLQFISELNKGSVFWFSVLNRSNKMMINKDESSSREDSIITIPLNTINLNLNLSFDIELYKEKINIILADDEKLIRESTKRIVNKYAQKKRLRVNIFEAVDGIDILWLVFHQFFKKAESEAIDIIISDENMMMYSGQKAVKKLRKMEKQFKMNAAQFYINSTYSYQKTTSNNYNITGFLHKPLMISDIELIFDNYFETHLVKNSLSNLL